MLAIVCLAGVGCNSVFHRARPLLPPDPCAQLQMRIDEARRAEDRAQQAARTLRNHLDRGAAGEMLQTDFDRLQAAAFDLERRVLAARDVASACQTQPHLTGEIEPLARRAKAWLSFVEAARQAAPAQQLRLLDEMLARPPAVSAA